jgi:GntR family transcriptional repressor for pyruvate dehydrogenase complex
MEPVRGIFSAAYCPYEVREGDRDMKTALRKTVPERLRASLGQTLSSQIVNHVRDALFNGELHPGDILGSETELAERFGVSRLCARDALRSLEAMGIVVIRMGAAGGARVAQPDFERFTDALSIQLALLGMAAPDSAAAEGAIESMTAELAARHATPADLESLRVLLDQAERCLDDPARSDQLGREFHLAVARASHNRFLEAQLHAFRSGVWRAVGVAMTKPIATSILRTHRELYEMIRQRDADGARRLMKEHVSATTAKRAAGRGGRGVQREAHIACFPSQRRPSPRR